jgi:hypothetical protein
MSISISVAYVAEIERLRHDIERHIAMASELATENERLRAELATADAFHKVAVKARDYERTVVDGLWAELESWIEAFGLLSTLHETMPINADDPMGMAKQIESHVRATIERLREYAGHKPECIVLWMEEQEQYPCDCGYDDLVKEIGE